MDEVKELENIIEDLKAEKKKQEAFNYINSSEHGITYMMALHMDVKATQASLANLDPSDHCGISGLQYILKYIKKTIEVVEASERNAKDCEDKIHKAVAYLREVKAKQKKSKENENSRVKLVPDGLKRRK